MSATEKSPEGRYGSLAIALHWLIAAAIAVQLSLGFIVHNMEPGSFARFETLQWHKSLGLTILLLSLARLLWRLFHGAPPVAPGRPRIERRLARGVHIALYVLMIAVPLAGWATVSASPLGLPTHIFGLVPWPHLPFFEGVADREAAEHLMHKVHQALVWMLIVLAGGHILAALRHQFLLGDATLARMIPWLGTGRPGREAGP